MKKLISIILACCMVASLCSCATPDDEGDKANNDHPAVITAIIKLPDGTIVSGDVDSFQRWSSSNTEIEIDGVIYYVHPVNCILIEGA